jgi:hypothetical protein
MPPQMSTLLRHPLVILLLPYCVMAVSAQLGLFFRRNQQQLEDADYHDRGVVLGATLTLLGLLIGFTFSMAISRYDQRKNCEEQEANAIATEYLRSNLLLSAGCSEFACKAKGVSRPAHLFLPQPG